ncbi:right-handed parallel beta-helix repeat-containing protein [Alkalihalobacterium alkalinitrilicum]|uniref:right-handed parallel beta-helix repeat-containing protein n=1 Tax=Alkalihalobacterium alkalinitrilicum TaxID=427920 RepID=UPI000994F722|nr:right-handed parallel beta-helix repeat-containing protein [Alkalihalobacterium alkalinitrilicum]
MKKIILFVFTCFLFFFLSVQNKDGQLALLSVLGKQETTYELDLKEWNIYNDGSHPIETTNGINDALQWASENDYTVFKVPEGHYLIDKDSHIEMVSNITFWLDDNAILQKETNDYSSYKLLHIGPGVENVTLKGGTYKGDKDTHDYSNGGTHEHGYGIIISGASEITLENVKAINFTGDGMSIGKMGTLIQDVYAPHFESGGVDAEGHLINDPTKSRLTNLPIEHPYFDIQRTFQFIHQQNMPEGSSGYIAYFYKEDGTFLSKQDSRESNTPVGWGLTSIPEEAAYFHAVFPMPEVPDDIYLEYWMQGVSKQITVKNSEFAHNRRQGITVGGAQDVLITNSQFHNMGGAAPESGIDLEAGYNLNDNIHIKENQFYNNAKYDLILYDGRNAIVENNHFASKGAIGLAISEPFKYAKINNNHFDGTKIYAYNHATFRDNKMNDGLAAFLGYDLVIDGMTFTDTLVNLASAKPFGIEASNISVNNTKKMHTPFGINKNPIHLKNITITGEAALDSLSGNASDGSVFENIKVVGYNRTQLPRGTYKNCKFSATENDTIYGSVAVNNSGEYIFDNCVFESRHGGFSINSVHGIPDHVAITNSEFNALGDTHAITITSAKKVELENNNINAHHMERLDLEILRVGSYWTKDEPYEVKDLTIRKNTIRSNLENKGISTIYSGENAPPYIIEGNVLYNATLDLKENDLAINIDTQK